MSRGQGGRPRLSCCHSLLLLGARAPPDGPVCGPPPLSSHLLERAQVTSSPVQPRALWTLDSLAISLLGTSAWCPQALQTCCGQ